MKRTLLLLVAALLYITESYPQASFNTGAIEVSVNQYGRVRLFTPDGTRHLQRASILVGTSATTVFDYQNDSEELEPTVLVTNPAMSDFEIYGAYDNSYSGDPPDVNIFLNAYGWNNGCYTLIKQKVKNTATSAVNASIGLDIIPELNQEYGFDTITYNAAEGVIRFHRGSQVNMGIKLVSASLSSLYSFEWYDGYEVDADYWTWMHFGSLQPQYISNTIDGPVTITAQNAVSLGAGQSVDVYYVLALGNNEAQMLANINLAEEKYNSVVVTVEENELSQNATVLKGTRPNPFNRSTTISYQLKESGFVNLTVFDALGNEVATLVNSSQTTGTYDVDFNAAGLSEGVYYYTLTSNNQVVTKKMVVTR